jgi:hypothetical protein
MADGRPALQFMAEPVEGRGNVHEVTQRSGIRGGEPAGDPAAHPMVGEWPAASRVTLSRACGQGP